MSTVDLAQAFCDLWDRFAANWTVTEIEERLLEGVVERADLVQAICMSGALRAGFDELEPLDVAIAIDLAFGQIHPGHRGLSTPPALDVYLSRHHSFGSLLDDGSNGGLILKWGNPIRTDSVSAMFPYVLRVPPDAWHRVDRCVPRPEDDIALPLAVPEVTVACQPFADSIEDLPVARVQGIARYRLGPPADSTVGRIPDALRELARSQAAIGVLPEGCASEQTTVEWSRVLRETPPEADEKLGWILIGTGPCGPVSDPPANRAVVLSRLTGEIVFEQDKRSRYLMEPSTIADWGLSALLSPLEVLDEHISPGGRLSVLECRWGRVVIAICEDLARPWPGGTDFYYAAPRLVLAPVFDRELDASRWERFRGADLASGIGASTVVSNSLVVARRRGQSGAVGTSMMVNSRDEVTINQSSVALEVTTFKAS